MDTIALMKDERLAWCEDMTPGKPLIPYRGDLLRFFPKTVTPPNFLESVRSCGLVPSSEVIQFVENAKIAPGVVQGDEGQSSISLLCHNPDLFARMNNALLDRNVLDLLRLRWVLYKVLEGLRASPMYISEGQLYRCVLKRVNVTHLVPGRVFAWHSFTFLHTSSVDARKLLWDSKTRTYDSTMFVIRGVCWGYDVSQYVPELLSESTGKLILLEPERLFRVIRVTVGSPIVVDIEMCHSDPILKDLLPLHQDIPVQPDESSSSFLKAIPDRSSGSGIKSPELEVKIKQAVRGSMRLALETYDRNIFDVPIQHVITEAEFEEQNLCVAVRKELTQKEIDEELEAVLNECNDGSRGGASASGRGKRESNPASQDGDGEEERDLSRLPLWKRQFYEQPTAASVEPNVRAMDKEAEEEIEKLTKFVEMMCNPNIILPESETMQELDQILMQQQHLLKRVATVVPSTPQETLSPGLSAEDVQEEGDLTSSSGDLPSLPNAEEEKSAGDSKESRGSLSLLQQLQQREKKHHGVWTKIRTHFASSGSTTLPNAQVIAAASMRKPSADLMLMVKRSQNLTEFPETIHFCQTLQLLDVSHNRLMKVPDEIGELKALRVLDLSDNSLTSIPSTIGEMKDLMILNLERNWLASLPDTLSSLTSLRSLNLDNNQLRVVPSMLGVLTRLEELTLAENEITELSENVLSIPSLVLLSVVKNPCVDKLCGLVLCSGFPII